MKVRVSQPGAHLGHLERVLVVRARGDLVRVRVRVRVSVRVRVRDRVRGRVRGRVTVRVSACTQRPSRPRAARGSRP